MRPSFNSRGMPSSFVTSPDVSLRREKCIPAKIMKPLFHFFSLHFISPPPPLSHLISRSGPACTTTAYIYRVARVNQPFLCISDASNDASSRGGGDPIFENLRKDERIGIVGVFMRVFKRLLIEDFIEAESKVNGFVERVACSWFSFNIWFFFMVKERR